MTIQARIQVLRVSQVMCAVAAIVLLLILGVVLLSTGGSTLSLVSLLVSLTACVTTLMSSEIVLARLEKTSAFYVAGARVLVHWNDGGRYPGIVRERVEDTCTVMLFDGRAQSVSLRYLSPG